MVAGRAVLHSQRDPHRRGHSDGRRATHDHGADRVGYLFVVAAGDVDFFRGQLGLINKTYARLCPFQGLDHESLILEHFRDYAGAFARGSPGAVHRYLYASRRL